MQRLRLEWIEMGGHAAGDDQPAQWKPLVVRHLPRPVDPASGNVAVIDGDGRTFGTSPVDQAIAKRVAVRVVGHDLVEQRGHITGEAGVDEEGRAWVSR